ncbi:MAG TPA: response regulator [Chitinophaga sp.]|uniref:response regulator n=1 Tax=Chitinophaga sp. TaxID=1869181 RepID=UPI002F9549FB
MQALNILAIGRNPEIMAVINRLLNTPENRTGITVTTDEEALAAIQTTAFDLVLLCAGISEQEGAALTAKLLQLQPGVPVIRHYGGGSGLLDNEIQAALANKQTK